MQHGSAMPRMYAWSDIVYMDWSQLHGRDVYRDRDRLAGHDTAYRAADMTHDGAFFLEGQVTNMLDWLNYIVLAGTDWPIDTSRVIETIVRKDYPEINHRPGWSAHIEVPVGSWYVLGHTHTHAAWN
jgi:hypothetical protein